VFSRCKKKSTLNNDLAVHYSRPSDHGVNVITYQACCGTTKVFFYEFNLKNKEFTFNFISEQ